MSQGCFKIKTWFCGLRQGQQKQNGARDIRRGPRHFSVFSHQHLRPLWDFVGVAFDDGAIGETEEDACLATVDGVVVDINPVCNTGGHLAVDDGFLIARDNLGNGNIVATLHHAAGNAGCVDHGRFGADKEQADEETSLLCPTDEVQFVVGRKNRLENHALLISQTLLAPIGTVYGSLPHRLGRVPVAEPILRHLVGIDIDRVLEPFMVQYLGCNGGFARAIGAGNDYQDRSMGRFGHSTANFFCNMVLISIK